MGNMFKDLVGKIVLFVLDEGPSKGEVRPAIVVKQWQPDAGTIQLQVFVDDLNDGLDVAGCMWKTSVSYDHEKTVGTWHFKEDN